MHWLLVSYTVYFNRRHRWQAVLGDESLVQKLRDRVKGLHKQRREITSLRVVLRSVDPKKILQKVAKKYGVERQRLVARGERRLQAKNVAMDGLGDWKQIAARDRRTFWRLGLWSGSPADSPNQVHLQRKLWATADHHNVKCLDLTPYVPYV